MPQPTYPILVPFGENAASGTITLPIPVPSQIPANPGRASFNDGFPSDTMGAGATEYPSGLDFNGILFMLSAYAAAQTGGFFWPFNSSWEAENGGYPAGAILAMAAGNGFWLNTVNGNANNPDTTAAASSGWVPLAAYGSSSVALSGSNVTLTAVQAAMPQIVLTGTLTANVQVIFPTWVTRWRIINNCSGAYTVTAKTSGGSGIYVPPLSSYGATVIYCDGTSIWPLTSQVAQLSSTAVLTTASTRTNTTTISADSVLTQEIYLPGTYKVRAWLIDGSGTPSAGGLSATLGFSGTLGTPAQWSSSSNGEEYISNALNERIATNPSSGWEFESQQTGNGSIFITGCFLCTTPGTLALWWAQATANATASVLSAGSFLEVSPAINVPSLV